MSYYGDIALGATIDFKFTTIDAGIPTTLSGSPVASVYFDNDTGESASGVTLSVDFDGKTGLNNVRIVASGGNGFATGRNYSVVITAGTVGNKSLVGYVVGEFSIENRSALRPATAGRTIVIDSAGLADANVVKLGPSGSGTAQTARDVGGNVDATISSRSTLTAANVWDALLSGITTASTIGKLIKDNLDAAISTRSTYAGGDTSGVTTLLSRIASTLTITGGKVDVNDKTGFSLSSDGIQAIWDALTSAMTTVGSIGKRLSDNIDAAISSVGGGSLTAADIWNYATRTLSAFGFSVTVGTNNDKTDYSLVTPPLDAAGTRSALGLASANLDTQLAGIAGYIDTEVASILSMVTLIKAKTDNLPADTNLSLTTIDNLVDDLESRLTALRAGYLDNLASGVSTLTAANVWSHGTRTLTSGGGGGGSDASEIWSYPFRTLTQSASQVNAILRGTDITIYNNATMRFSIINMADSTGYVKMWLTAKSNPKHSDTKSMFQIELSDPTDPADGLQYINSTIPSGVLSNEDGSITVVDNTSIDVVLSANAMKQVPAGTYQYDVKVLMDDDTVILLSADGKIKVLDGVTKVNE